MATSKPNLSPKILVLGDANVGKTAVISRFSMGAFITEYDPTGPEDIHRKVLTVNGQKRLLEVTDGHNDPDTTIPAYRYPWNDAQAVVIIYALSDRQSFERIGDWVARARKEKGHDVPIVIVGNKTDIRNESGRVSSGEGRSRARELGVGFAECSAKDGSGVEEVFLDLVGRIVGTDEKEGEEDEIKSGKGKEKKKGSFMLKILELVAGSLRKAQG